MKSNKARQRDPSFAISAVISVVASARVVGLKALSIHRKTRGL